MLMEVESLSFCILLVEAACMLLMSTSVCSCFFCSGCWSSNCANTSQDVEQQQIMR